ncbi:phospholipid-binding lipoprotein MlaA [Shimia isoporae]|uniref:Phospholipid-binding lipoprotein MlaA n=1 Tax=Shimia isoporae TaxID=647720 RepID=A0A4R1N597_9RHOB|nr:VacJ family lipoprotein [Shimia isoporae]TCL01250.1 phospholipid-binding lipoprotein MlaA [Shimia isoporae]
MSSRLKLSFGTIFRTVPLCAALFLAACGSSNGVSRGLIYDPHEENNRGTHEFNKVVDRVLLSPASTGYGTVIPPEIRDRVGDFSDHLSLPNDVINNTLQGKLGGAGNSAARFVINTVVGFGGFVDVASLFGMKRHDTDFGETLHVWGAQEGAYVELPFLGPSTSRDTVGLLVDIVFDPFFVVLSEPTSYLSPTAYVINAMGDRYDYQDTVDSLLYESADSYAQARIIYLQNRRFELGIESDDSEDGAGFDPYEDPYNDF